MTERTQAETQAETPADRTANRRTLLLCAGLAGAGGAAALLTACSTAAVPYDANEQGQAPGAELAAAPANSASAASATAAAHPAGGAGTRGAGSGSGTVLGKTAEIPVGGGMIFTDAKVVVTQPTKGVFKAFSAICTHVGCLCNQVADGTIDCPCHGSRFTISDGAVIAGPAPTALPAAPITVADGKIMLR